MSTISLTGQNDSKIKELSQICLQSPSTITPRNSGRFIYCLVISFVNWLKRKFSQMFDTLFLDRDGVINEKLENRYVTCVKEFVFIDGVLESFTTISKFSKES